MWAWLTPIGLSLDILGFGLVVSDVFRDRKVIIARLHMRDLEQEETQHYLDRDMRARGFQIEQMAARQALNSFREASPRLHPLASDEEKRRHPGLLEVYEEKLAALEKEVRRADSLMTSASTEPLPAALVERRKQLEKNNEFDRLQRSKWPLRIGVFLIPFGFLLQLFGSVGPLCEPSTADHDVGQLAASICSVVRMTPAAID